MRGTSFERVVDFMHLRPVFSSDLFIGHNLV